MNNENNIFMDNNFEAEENEGMRMVSADEIYKILGSKVCEIKATVGDGNYIDMNITTDDGSVHIEVYPYLSFEGQCSFASNIAEMVLNKSVDEETGAVTCDYKPFFRDGAIKCCVAEYYTNIDVSAVGVDGIYDLFTATPVGDEILRHVGATLDSGVRAADELIAYTVECDINIQRREVQQMQKRIYEMQAEIEEFMDTFTAYCEQFKNVDANRMVDVVERLAAMDTDNIAVRVAELRALDEQNNDDKEDTDVINENGGNTAK